MIRKTFISAGMVVFMVVCALAYLVPTPRGCRVAHIKFDRQLWLADRDLALRTRMIKDLVTRVLPRLTEGEVTRLLGPTAVNRWTEGGVNRSVLSYWVGFDRVALDMIEMQILFDEEGRFLSWHVTGFHDWGGIVGPPGSKNYSQMPLTP